jgi:hypothetical protein
MQDSINPFVLAAESKDCAIPLLRALFGPRKGIEGAGIETDFSQVWGIYRNIYMYYIPI